MRASLARDADGISRLEAALAPHHRRVHRLGLGRGPGEGRGRVRGRGGGAEAVVVAARADEVTRNILSGGLQSGSETINYKCVQLCMCHVSRRLTSRCSGTGWRWRPVSRWGSRTPCRGWRGCGSTWGSLRRTQPGTLRPRPSPPPSAGGCHAAHYCHDWRHASDWCHAARGWGPRAAESCRGCCWRPGLRGNRILVCLETFKSFRPVP